MKHYHCGDCDKRWDGDDDACQCPYCYSWEVYATDDAPADAISDDGYKYCTRCGAANYKNEATCTTCNMSSDFVDTYAEYESVKNSQTAEMLRAMLEAEKAKLEADTRRRVEEEVQRRLAEELAKRGEAPTKPAQTAQATAKPPMSDAAQLDEWYNEGKRLFEITQREHNKDYRPAVEYLKKAAERGHAPSQYLLYHCHEWHLMGLHHEGIPYEEAEGWFDKAIAQNYPPALCRLAFIYENGGGSKYPKDPARALELYKHAASLGDSEGQYNIGRYYYDGIAVRKDLAQALKWYTAAADNGDGDGEAQRMVGYIYENGSGVDIDLRRALAYYKKAQANKTHDADADVERVQELLSADFNKVRGWYDKGYTAYQNRDYYEATEWLQKAAVVGYAPAQNLYAVCYRNGYGVDKDVDEAFRWYTRAATNGHAEAQMTLGGFYASGDCGVAPDFEKAKYWFKLAIKNGVKSAVNALKSLKRR